MTCQSILNATRLSGTCCGVSAGVWRIFPISAKGRRLQPALNVMDGKDKLNAVRNTHNCLGATLVLIQAASDAQCIVPCT